MPIQRYVFHKHNKYNNDVILHKLSLQRSAISRLYARHLLSVAFAVAATETARSNLWKSKSECEEYIAKPTEWKSAIDLETRRKEFGKQISSLGSTKVERAWAAGSRIVSLTLLASPLLLLAPLAFLSGRDSKPD
mmetsp:Transcript_15946/g.21875  ORF Transcript_15946/g.21875 Transcript_15946/m.21875 type:complete len:135 (-) Transcript_15946:615-1019(-)